MTDIAPDPRKPLTDRPASHVTCDRHLARAGASPRLSADRRKRIFEAAIATRSSFLSGAGGTAADECGEPEGVDLRALYQPHDPDPDASSIGRRVDPDNASVCRHRARSLRRWEIYLNIWHREFRFAMAGSDRRFQHPAGFGLRGVSARQPLSPANDISEAAIRRAAETMTSGSAKGARPGPPARTNNSLYTQDDHSA